MIKTRPNNGNGYKCDWCGMSYPLGGWDYYQLVLFGRELKTICSDCYNHLHHITVEKQLHKPEVDSSQPLDVKQEGGNGIPPTNKLVGILPKIL